MTSESRVQTDIRLYLARHHPATKIWRNNSGAFPDQTGRLVRFGLGNDSSKINKVFKSSDLIGVTPYVIQPHDVGDTLGIFTAIEVKTPDWPGVRNDRERAQEQFLRVVESAGGLQCFARNTGDVTAMMYKYNYRERS